MLVHCVFGEAYTQIKGRDRGAGGVDDNGTVTLQKHEAKLFSGQTVFAWGGFLLIKQCFGTN